jgi:hypothetical protein
MIISPMKTGTLHLQSMLTCPHCGHQATETMPTDACIFFYDCTKCGALLRPKEGDCCVFCSYGSVACPPVQQDRSCCASAERPIASGAPCYEVGAIRGGG